MNVRHLVPSVSRRLLVHGMLSCWHRPAAAGSRVRRRPPRSRGRIEPQYIAALGDPGATSGNGAQSWGLWSSRTPARAVASWTATTIN